MRDGDVAPGVAQARRRLSSSSSAGDADDIFFFFDDVELENPADGARFFVLGDELSRLASLQEPRFVRLPCVGPDDLRAAAEKNRTV